VGGHQELSGNRHRPRDAYRHSVAAGTPLTGAALGDMFDRSPRWGTDRVAEVRRTDIGRTDTDTAHAAAAPRDQQPSSNGHHPPTATSTNGSRARTPVGHTNGDANGNRPLPIRNETISDAVRHAGAAHLVRAGRGERLLSDQTGALRSEGTPFVTS
jgi:hypothetical protein